MSKFKATYKMEGVTVSEFINVHDTSSDSLSGTEAAIAVAKKRAKERAWKLVKVVEI